MHKRLVLSGVFSGVLLSATIHSQEFLQIDHHWNFIAEFVYMRRNELDGKTLVEDEDKSRKCGRCDDFTVMRTSSIINHFDLNPGARLGLTYTEETLESTFELLALWIAPWHATKTVGGDASLFFPFSQRDYAFDYFDASKAEGEGESKFWDLELNYWRHASPRNRDYFSASWIAGLRYFHLNESFKLTFYKPPDVSDWSVHTKNNIFGAQLGGNLQWNPSERLSWDITVKLGAMANRAKQWNFLKDHNNTEVLRHYQRQKWQLGLFGDAAIQAGYQFKEPFNLHLGYEVMYISGVALAPEQMQRSTNTESGKHVYTKGYVLIQGLFAGATFSF